MKKVLGVLVSSALVLGACKGGKGDADKAFADFSAAYKPTYDELRHLGLSDVQQKVWAAGDAGKPLQPEVDALKKRADEVEALINDANQKASDGRAKDDAAMIKKGTDALAEARKKAAALEPEISALAAKVPAAQPTTP